MTPESTLLPPTVLDPRLLVMVPRAERAAVTALWRLEARLFDVVAYRSEVMLAQIKLAWWRERLAQVSADPAALPKGEPLLAALAVHWHGRAALSPLVDAYEAIMLAEDADMLSAAGEVLGRAMGEIMGCDAGAGRQWGLVRAAQLAADAELHTVTLGCVITAQAGPGHRLLRALDRWALLLAHGGGTASPRAEGWLLLRAGIGL